jgi:hypothetical protein
LRLFTHRTLSVQVPFTISLRPKLLAPRPLTQPSSTENSPFFIKLSAGEERLQATAVIPEELEVELDELLLEEIFPLLEEDDELDDELLAGTRGTIAGIKLLI